MLLLDDSVFNTTFVKLDTVLSSLLERAPCSALDKSTMLSAPSIIDKAFSEFATVAKSTAPTFRNVDASAVVPPPVKLSEAFVPALDVTENDLTESN